MNPKPKPYRFFSSLRTATFSKSIEKPKEPATKEEVALQKALRPLRGTQRAQYPLIKEYSFNHTRDPSII